MKNDQDKAVVLSILRDSGFEVEPINESPDHKTPDLQVVVTEGRILIEVKSKEDDQQLRDLLKSPKGTPLFYKTSSLETCLRDARRQIIDFPNRKEADFTLVWFVTRKHGSITVLTNSTAMGTLYGTEVLEGRMSEGGEYYHKECFFFYESFFFKHKDLDAVVLHDDQSIQLCFNPYSSRYTLFKQTAFTGMFRAQFSVVDPEVMESEDKCFITDCPITREDINGVVRYLKSKYGLDTVEINKFVLVNCSVD